MANLGLLATDDGGLLGPVNRVLGGLLGGPDMTASPDARLAMAGTLLQGRGPTLANLGLALNAGAQAKAAADQQERVNRQNELQQISGLYRALKDDDARAQMAAAFGGAPYAGPSPALRAIESRMGNLAGAPSLAGSNVVPFARAPGAMSAPPMAGAPGGFTQLPGSASASPQPQQLPQIGQPQQIPQQLPLNTQSPASMAQMARAAGIPDALAQSMIASGQTAKLLEMIGTALAPKNGAAGVTRIDPRTGEVQLLGGNATPGTVPWTMRNGVPVANPIQGAAEEVARAEGLKTEATAQANARNDLVALPQGDGTVRYVTRAQALAMTGPQGGGRTPIPLTPSPSNPSQVTPSNPYGYGVTTQVSPEAQHARDVQRLQILLQERTDQLKQYGKVDPDLEREIGAVQDSAHTNRNAKAAPWEQGNAPSYQAPSATALPRVSGLNPPGLPASVPGFSAGQSTAAKTAAEVNPKLQLETLQQSFTDNSKANDSLLFTEAARRAVNGATTTGLFAKPALLAARVGAAFGISDPQMAADPEVFMAMAGRSVMGVIKNLGSGSGISDADREYAAKAMGGDIRLNQESINRLLDINERAVRRGVELHNGRVAQAAQAGVPSVFSYEIQPYSAAGQTTVTLPGGRTYNFPNAQAAQQFKQQAGIQ